MNSGIYKVFNKIHGTNGVHKRLLGRLLVHDNKMYHLEDHGMHDIFPEGDIGDVHEKAFAKCSGSYYFSVEKEEMDVESSFGGLY